MPRPDAAQLGLALPGAEHLFPRRRSDFAEWCLAKIGELLKQDPVVGTVAAHWHVAMKATDRAFLLRVARLPRELSQAQWDELTGAQRAALLAAFDQLCAWCRAHAALSIDADPADYVRGKASGQF